MHPRSHCARPWGFYFVATNATGIPGTSPGTNTMQNKLHLHAKGSAAMTYCTDHRPVAKGTVSVATCNSITRRFLRTPIYGRRFFFGRLQVYLCISTLAPLLSLPHVEARQVEVCPHLSVVEVQRRGSDKYDGKDILYESQAILLKDDTYLYRYCLRNDHHYSTLYFHWHGETERYAKTHVLPGEVEVTELQSGRIPADPDDRNLEYGPSRRYGESIKVETVFRTSNFPPIPTFVFAQYEVMKKSGFSLPEALKDPKMLNRYLDHLRQQEGSPSIRLLSKSNVWMPTTDHLLSTLKEGNPIDAKVNQFYEMTFGVDAEITSTDKLIKLNVFAAVPPSSMVGEQAFETLGSIDLRLFDNKENVLATVSTQKDSTMAELGQLSASVTLGRVGTGAPVSFFDGHLEILIDDTVVSEIPFEGFAPQW